MRRVLFKEGQLQNGIEIHPLSNGYELAYIQHRQLGYDAGLSLEQALSLRNIFVQLAHQRAFGSYMLIHQMLRDWIYRPIFSWIHPKEHKCLLCPAFMPLRERGLNLGKFDNRLKDWNIYINPFFWATDIDKKLPSFIVARRQHGLLPLREVIRFGALISMQMPQVILGWNGPGRSVADHAHFQGVFRKYAIHERPLVEKGEGLWAVKDWPASHLIVKGSADDWQALVQRVQDVVEKMLQQGMAENMIDLIWDFDDETGELRIFIFPRSRIKPEAGSFKFGLSELMGQKVVADAERKLFNVDQPDEAAEIFINMIREVSKPVEDFDLAMINPVNEPGGIDLNSQTLDLDEQGEKIKFDFSNSDFDPAQLQDLQGLKPVIINVVPITPAMFNRLLGKADAESDSANQEEVQIEKRIWFDKRAS